MNLSDKQRAVLDGWLVAMCDRYKAFTDEELAEAASVACSFLVTPANIKAGRVALDMPRAGVVVAGRALLNRLQMLELRVQAIERAGADNPYTRPSLAHDADDSAGPPFEDRTQIVC